MRKVGWVLVGLVLFASAANGIRLCLRNKEDQEAATLAYRTLKSTFSSGKTLPVVGYLDRPFEVLLSNPYGPALLKELSEESPLVGFHEGRHAVFYLGIEPMNRDGTVDSAFCSYASVHKGPDRGQYSAGARFPGSVLLRRVAVEGDSVLVEFEISKSEKKPVVHDGFSFEPGTAYVTRMGAAALLNPNEPEIKVYSEFFPKSKKK